MDEKKIKRKLDMIESCTIKMKEMLEKGTLQNEWGPHVKYIEDKCDEIETELSNE